MTTPQTDAPERIWAVHWNTDGSVLNGGWADTVRHFGGGVEYVRADAHEATISALVEALEWYSEMMASTTSAATIHLEADYGCRARAALAKAAALK